MPRISRGLAGGEVYHVINRGNRQSEVFHSVEDYEKFIKLMTESKKLNNIELYGFALMPNHFHLILKPQNAEDLSKFMQWLLTSYVRYYNKIYKTSGHLWQGRYKSFIVQQNNYLLVLCRYIEQNPKRAKLKNWKFVTSRYMQSGIIDTLPIEVPEGWEEVQKKPLDPREKKDIENSIKRQSPYGEESWQSDTCDKYEITSTIRPIGRPKKIIDQ